MFKIEWRLAKSNYPKEIIDFMNEIFEICEIRGKVGITNGIIFEIRSNEGKHHIPHVHASYGEYSISIEISDTPKILAGNLPKSKHKVAIDWIKIHKDELLSIWEKITINADSYFTKSNLYLVEVKGD